MSVNGASNLPHPLNAGNDANGNRLNGNVDVSDRAPAYNYTDSRGPHRTGALHAGSRAGAQGLAVCTAAISGAGLIY